ncbi:hypothetical protein [Paenibacillus piri]|uniref:hypothetical protein n=1 Tax=Paenibacillus piri TaxID=2547395 RepID=UPI001404728D|nr:hypothetical protein [Paenibacillus piri]
MASGLWAELFLWTVLFAGIVGSFCACLYKLVTNDSAEYDLEFVWDSKYTMEELGFKHK